jgi:hypothetical protein
VRYHVSFSRAAVRASSLAAVRTVRGRPAFTCVVGVNTSCHSKMLLQSPKHISVWTTTRITQWVLPCSSTSSTLAGDPSCVPCFFILPKRGLYRDKCHCWELWYPIWWWLISWILNVSGYTLYNILWFFFNKESHCWEPVCEFPFDLYVSTCICLSKNLRLYIIDYIFVSTCLRLHFCIPMRISAYVLRPIYPSLSLYLHT